MRWAGGAQEDAQLLFELSAMEAKPRYNLMTSLVVPRPIAWVTSQSAAGLRNAAPFSFFNVMSGNPPVVCIGIGVRDGQPKDSARNIAETGEFVVNLVSEPMVKQMNVTAIEFEEEVDELREAGLRTLASHRVCPPRLADVPASLECVVRQIVAIGGKRSLVIADVVVVHVRDSLVLNPARGHIATPELGLVGRMHGGGCYARTTDLFQLPRIDRAEWTVGKSDKTTLDETSD